MSVIVNYAKKDYDAKITQLEGYNNLLNEHLGKMRELKGQIKEFWSDDNTETTVMILHEMILKTERTMDDVKENLIFYRSIVDKLEGVNNSSKGVLEEALGFLKLV